MQSLCDLTSEKLARFLPRECIDDIAEKYIERVRKLWIIEIDGIDGGRLCSLKKPNFEFYQSQKMKDEFESICDSFHFCDMVIGECFKGEFSDSTIIYNCICSAIICGQDDWIVSMFDNENFDSSNFTLFGHFARYDKNFVNAIKAYAHYFDQEDVSLALKIQEKIDYYMDLYNRYMGGKISQQDFDILFRIFEPYVHITELNFD